MYTKAVESVSAQTLMTHIQAHTRKESVYYTDAFRGYQSLQRFGKHMVVNHSKGFVSKKFAPFNLATPGKTCCHQRSRFILEKITPVPFFWTGLRCLK